MKSIDLSPRELIELSEHDMVKDSKFKTITSN